jgi:ABC-type antimicrobial peptide transport system permease subunit
MVLREGMAVAFAGALLGLAGAWAAGGMLEGLLYEVGPHDLGVLTSTVGVLLAVALLAALLPSRRATRADPLEVMRAE